jgi:hypothetical protein
LRFARLDLAKFEFAGTRGNTAKPCPDHWHIANGFGYCDRAVVIVCNTDFFANSAATYRRAFQKSESALDWPSSDGRARLGYCD